MRLLVVVALLAISLGCKKEPKPVPLPDMCVKVAHGGDDQIDQVLCSGRDEDGVAKTLVLVAITKLDATDLAREQQEERVVQTGGHSLRALSRRLFEADLLDLGQGLEVAEERA